MSLVNTPTQNLLVIDSHVTNWQSLANGVAPNTAVLILDSGSDGLTQISNYLATLTNAGTQNFVPLQSLQIISHGSAGSLLLGSSTISTGNLSFYSKQLASIGSNLTDTGDILLYGCDVAADKPGLDFINQIAALTSTDVAASNDITGSETLGGNWQLEVAAGTIESALPLNTATLNSYTGILNISVNLGISELFMSAYDSSSKNTYSFDTGLTIDAFIAAASSATYAYTQDLSLDTNWTSGFLGAAGFNAATTVYALAVANAYNPDVLLTSSAVGGLAPADNDQVVNTFVDNIKSQAGMINYQLTGSSKVVNDGGVTNTGQFNQFDTVFGNQTGASISGAYGSTLAFFHENLVLNEAGDAWVANVSQFAGSWKLTGNTLSFGAVGNHAPTGVVTINGTATQNQVLTANNTLADLDGLGTISYQWLADGTAISGETASTLTLGQAQVGKTITAQADYTDLLGTTEKMTSSATANVVNVNDLPTGTVTITGIAKQNQVLTATNTLADLDGLGTITYQWLADGVAIDGATTSTLTLDQAQVGKTITVNASYTDQQNTTESMSSSATNVVNSNNAPTGTVTITGTATQNEILTATNNLADVDGLGIISYQWLANGTAITGATAETLTLGQAQVGKAITVQAGYTDLLGTSEKMISSATANVVNVNDAPTGTVTITGTATQNQILTASNSLADVDGLTPNTITYQWLADGVVIDGAINTTLTLGQAQVGKAITVQASYTDLLNTAEKMISSATANVVNVNDLPSGTVTISGTATQNQILTASNTLADVDGLNPNTITYQWLADGTAINGATATTLTLAQAQVGKIITVQAGYTDLLGAAESVTSSATNSVIHVNHLPTGAVTITGMAAQDQTLTVNSDLFDADGLGTITCQWFADGTAITGATSTTLTLGQAQVGKTITVKAAYTDGQGTAESVSSAETSAVANVNDLPTGTVTITGTATQGQTLTAANTLADLDGLVTPAYQWLAGGIAIEGATSATLVLAQAQVGKAITVKAAYTDLLGSAENVSSTATSTVVAVSNLNHAPTGTVTITGTATQGKTLTVTNKLTDVDSLGTMAYQWLAGGIAIDGATSATLALSQAQVGKTITVKAAYTDGQGTAESVSSKPTIAVKNVNDPHTGTVTITGTATQNQTLTAANSLADADGLGTIAYQWLANGTAISGAKASTLTLNQAQVGKAITVQASYTDVLGTAEKMTSLLPTSNVINANDAPTGQVTITGTATQGKTLTATNKLADADGLGKIAYQWFANDEAISGATASKLILAQAQVDKTITVKAAYTDLLGTAESVSSAPTLAVVNVNDAPTLTAFESTVATGDEDSPITVTFADLQAQGNEADVDSTIAAFVIKAVSTGSLKIGTSAETATIWNTSSNNTVDATHQAFWTPKANANGTLNAFTAVAKDDSGLVSAKAIQAKINVSPVRDDLNLIGKAGIDTLKGDKIDIGSYDTLNGLAGNDTISGLAGNDILIGGLGKDTLTGGTGRDTFVFNTSAESAKGSAKDIIKDFTHSEGDQIDLAGIDANTTITDNQGFDYIGATAFTGVAGELNYINGILAGDTNGDGVADFEIAVTLVGSPSLVIEDFVL